MILCDVNILVSAYRSDLKHHAEAKAWLHSTLNRNETIALADVVIASFLRIVTSNRIFTNPDSTDEAFGFIQALESAPATTRIVTPLGTQTFKDTCEDIQASGDMIPDAYLAALAISLGGSIATFDRDFRKFSNLKLIELG